MIRLLLLGLAALLASCGPRVPSASLDTLTATPWQATDIAGQSVAEDVTSYVTFADDGVVSGLGACNRFSGPYRLDEEGLHIGPLAATKMACAPAVMEHETRFLAALEETVGFDIMDDGVLVLLASPSGAPTMLVPFEDVPESDDEA